MTGDWRDVCDEAQQFESALNAKHAQGPLSHEVWSALGLARLTRRLDSSAFWYFPHSIDGTRR